MVTAGGSSMSTVIRRKNPQAAIYRSRHGIKLAFHSYHILIASHHIASYHIHLMLRRAISFQFIRFSVIHTVVSVTSLTPQFLCPYHRMYRNGDDDGTDDRELKHGDRIILGSCRLVCIYLEREDKGQLVRSHFVLRAIIFPTAADVDALVLFASSVACAGVAYAVVKLKTYDEAFSELASDVAWKQLPKPRQKLLQELQAARVLVGFLLPPPPAAAVPAPCSHSLTIAFHNALFMASSSLALPPFLHRPSPSLVSRRSTTPTKSPSRCAPQFGSRRPWSSATPKRSTRTQTQPSITSCRRKGLPSLSTATSVSGP